MDVLLHKAFSQEFTRKDEQHEGLLGNIQKQLQLLTEIA